MEYEFGGRNWRDRERGSGRQAAERQRQTDKEKDRKKTRLRGWNMSLEARTGENSPSKNHHGFFRIIK